MRLPSDLGLIFVEMSAEIYEASGDCGYVPGTHTQDTFRGYEGRGEHRNQGRKHERRMDW